MPNPDYGVVDNFNRADENPLSGGGRWRQLGGESFAWRLVSNVVYNAAGAFEGFGGAMLWAAARYGGNVQVALTCTDVGSTNLTLTLLDICVKMSDTPYNPPTFLVGDGYVMRIQRADTTTADCRIMEILDNGYTQLSTANTAFSVSDEFFFEALDDASGTMTIYKNGTSITSTTDSTYKSVIGDVWVKNASRLDTDVDPKWDDWKIGGTITEIMSWQTAADDATVGTQVWANTSNALTREQGGTDSVATCVLVVDEQGDYLKLTNHGATNYPAGTTFQGCLVFPQCSATVASVANWISVRLVIGGTITGDDKVDATVFTTTLSAQPSAGIGGASDMWGTTPTVAQMNANDLGVVLSPSTTTAATVNLGFCRVRWYSTLPVAASDYRQFLKNQNSNTLLRM